MDDADLNLLPALDALLAECSVAGAARNLGLSASAMSRTLARLRAATGDPLLVRAGRRLVPTPHAAELRERVRNLTLETRAVLRPAIKELELASLERTFTIRANVDFVETCAAQLIAAVNGHAPHVRLHFAPKPDKDVRALRDGVIDLEVGVMGESAPEVRVQALFRDRFVGVVRRGHALAGLGKVTAKRYAACSHVVASRRGRAHGPVDDALQEIGLVRPVVAVVPSFAAALAVARSSELVALVPLSFMNGLWGHQTNHLKSALHIFPLPVRTKPITVSQMWHPRMDADRAHRWLRGVLLTACRANSDLNRELNSQRTGRGAVASE
ncbi:MAG TPA: LysR family transcriptional regulator [Steroidobacteraceae bacterium]|jgi:DNA-binding transcriptional LysR family regulator|nr:LysR family transcriptional regulator [Steroidobacteraceae bacterium]